MDRPAADLPGRIRERLQDALSRSHHPRASTQSGMPKGLCSWSQDSRKNGCRKCTKDAMRFPRSKSSPDIQQKPRLERESKAGRGICSSAKVYGPSHPRIALVRRTTTRPTGRTVRSTATRSPVAVRDVMWVIIVVYPRQIGCQEVTKYTLATGKSQAVSGQRRQRPCLTFYVGPFPIVSPVNGKALPPGGLWEQGCVGVWVYGEPEPIGSFGCTATPPGHL